MTIKDMHYDFKKKLNKVDSQQYRNLLIPEIDWVLNEAYELFVKMIAEPRIRSRVGFEIRQRNIDDIRTIVVNDLPVVPTADVMALPNNYWFYVRGRVKMTKGSCPQTQGVLKIRQHDDEFERSPFDKSSYAWRFVNGVFFENGVKLYTDGSFVVDEVLLSYIRKPSYIHNAEDFRGGTYNLLDGTALVGSVDCELPDSTHREIVDLAVLITTGEIQSPDFNIKLEKLKLNNLI